jgi:hypothetical protein
VRHAAALADVVQGFTPASPLLQQGEIVGVGSHGRPVMIDDEPV